ncbi:MAG: quinone oxidoreductase family protein [Acidimicrobiales bacterium]
MEARAAVLVAHGEPLHVGRIDIGEPGPGEVVVEMSSAGVNPVDRYNALGRVAGDGPLPRVIGSEGVGRTGGRRVLVHGYGVGSRRHGTWCERVVVPAAALVEVPAEVDDRFAAAMGVAGVTAWRTVVELGRVGPGDRVLVLGAAGGVGSMITSLAHHLGAEVWGHSASSAKRRWIEERGADHVVVGDAQTVRDQLAGVGLTVAFDPLGAAFSGAVVEVLGPGGRLVLYGTSAGAEGVVALQQLYRKGLSVLGYGGLIEPEEELQRGMRGAFEALVAGQMEVVVDATVPLEEVNGALERLAGRQVLGKLVLDVG